MGSINLRCLKSALSLNFPTGVLWALALGISTLLGRSHAHSSTDAGAREAVLFVEEYASWPDSTISIPVKIDHGKEIALGEFTLCFDPDILLPLEVNLSDMTAGFSLADTVKIPGELRIVLANTSAIFQERGVLLQVIFQVDPDAEMEATTGIDLKNTSFFDTTGAPLHVEVRDGRFSIGSLTLLSFLLADVSFIPGSSITIPVLANPVSGIVTGELLLSYDPDILTPIGVQTAELTSGFSLVDTVKTPGKLGIILTGSMPLSGDRGEILNVSFDVNLDAIPGESSEINLERVSLYDESARPLKSAVRKTWFTVGDSPPGGEEPIPVTIDFDLADGDQQQRVAGGAIPGKLFELQLNVADAPEINGWSVNIEFDPSQVRYETGSFQASGFISGLLALVDEKEGTVSVGGTVLGTDAKNSGDGTLGTLSFEVLEGFTESTDLVITRVTFRRLDGVEDKRTVRLVATITGESILAGDFDGNGRVDFDDFFLFADGFGGTNPMYDLNNSGAVDFDDFFIFADTFGKEARAND